MDLLRLNIWNLNYCGCLLMWRTKRSVTLRIGKKTDMNCHICIFHPLFRSFSTNFIYFFFYIFFLFFSTISNMVNLMWKRTELSSLFLTELTRFFTWFFFFTLLQSELDNRGSIFVQRAPNGECWRIPLSSTGSHILLPYEKNSRKERRTLFLSQFLRS